MLLTTIGVVLVCWVAIQFAPKDGSGCIFFCPKSDEQQCHTLRNGQKECTKMAPLGEELQGIEQQDLDPGKEGEKHCEVDEFGDCVLPHPNVQLPEIPSAKQVQEEALRDYMEMEKAEERKRAARANKVDPKKAENDDKNESRMGHVNAVEKPLESGGDKEGRTAKEIVMTDSDEHRPAAHVFVIGEATTGREDNESDEDEAEEQQSGPPESVEVEDEERSGQQDEATGDSSTESNDEQEIENYQEDYGSHEAPVEKVPMYNGQPFSPVDVHRVAGSGEFHVLKAYLAVKPEWASWQDDNGWSAMHIAARMGQVQVLEILLQAGGDASLNTVEGKTARDIAIIYLGEEHAAVSMLPKTEGEDDSEDDEPMYEGRPFSVNDVLRETGEGRVDILKAYLNIKPEWANWQDQNGWSAMHIAARRGDEDIIRALLEAGGDASLTTVDGKTARELAEIYLGEQHPAAMLF